MAPPCTILVYGDSLTWGIFRTRGAVFLRGPVARVMETTSWRPGMRCAVVEDCLNGRRTVWDDPFKPGRNGARVASSSESRLNHPWPSSS